MGNIRETSEVWGKLFSCIIFASFQFCFATTASQVKKQTILYPLQKKTDNTRLHRGHTPLLKSPSLQNRTKELYSQCLTSQHLPTHRLNRQIGIFGILIPQKRKPPRNPRGSIHLQQCLFQHSKSRKYSMKLSLCHARIDAPQVHLLRLDSLPVRCVLHRPPSRTTVNERSKVVLLGLALLDANGKTLKVRNDAIGR